MEPSALGSLRPVRARVTGPGSGIDPELMKRLTQRVPEDGEATAPVLPGPWSRDAEPNG